ncbi:MAG: zinc ribbon domain-containing protein [Sedimentibacter sp.]
MASTTGTPSESTSRENGEVRFCAYCGTKLDLGARFCKSCGKPIVQHEAKNLGSEDKGAGSHVKMSDEPITKRQTVYEGYIHKCPNCGEILESFVTNCPSCGYEIRDAKSASTVREFAQKLERIEAQKMSTISEQKSVMKMVFGKDFKEKDEVEEAKNDFEKQKQKEKATLIINYSVPNTKEDILEFMLLAASNIDTKHGVSDVVTKAWISKLEQVYQKAEISMGSHSDFVQIKNIYEKKHNQIKLKKLTGVLGWVGLVAMWFFLMGMLWNPTITIMITIVVLFLSIIGFIVFRKR